MSKLRQSRVQETGNESLMNVMPGGPDKHRTHTPMGKKLPKKAKKR